MPNLTSQVDGTEVEVAQGSTVMDATNKAGVYVPHFCYHPELTIDGNCRMCLVEIEKVPKPADRLQHGGRRRHGRADGREGRAERRTHGVPAHQPPDRLPDLRPGRRVLPAGPLRWATALHRRACRRRKGPQRKVVDLGPIMLDAERCGSARAACASSAGRHGHQLLRVRGRGDHAEIATFEDRPIEHNYAGNLADVCPVGAPHACRATCQLRGAEDCAPGARRRSPDAR